MRRVGGLMRPLSVPESGSTYEELIATRGLRRLRLRARGWAYRSRVLCGLGRHQTTVPTAEYALRRIGEAEDHQPLNGTTSADVDGGGPLSSDPVRRDRVPPSGSLGFSNTEKR